MGARMIFGTYRKRDSYLHRIDPRTKLLLTAGVSIPVYLADPAGLALLAAIVSVFAVAARISVANLLRGLRPVAPFLAMIFLAHLAFGNSIPAAAIPVARFVLLILTTILLLHTTSPSELKTALASFMKPFGGPGAEIAFMVGVAMAFIPGLLLDKETIARAQAARGYRPKGLSGFTSLIVPLLRRSFRRADSLSDALESRCYHRDAARYYYNRELTRSDYLLVGGVALILVLSGLSVSPGT